MIPGERCRGWDTVSVVKKTTFLLLAGSVMACRPPEAPETFEEMMVYGFIHFNDDDPEALIALGDVIIPWLENNLEEIEDGYEIASMTAEDLSEAGVSTSTDISILGVSVGFDYTAGDLVRFTEAMVWEDQEDVFSHFVGFDREVQEGKDCFTTRECERYTAADSLHAEIALGIEFWSDYTVSMRHLTMSDGSPALVHRLIGPEPTEFSTEIINVYQQYGFSFLYNNADNQARRVQALWADGELLSSDAAEGSYLALSITTMKGANNDVNTWMLGE